VSTLVTLHVWRVPRTALARALWRMAVDRRRLRRTPGVSFAKLLGTGRDRRFGPADADPTRWAALTVWDHPSAADRFDATPVGRAWARLAEQSCRLTLAPISSRGAWAGREPFPAPGREPFPVAGREPFPVAGREPFPVAGREPFPAQSGKPDGPMLVLTRARLRARAAVTFWRTIPLVGAALPDDGLLAAFGIGEAPVGWQGTVSLWRDRADLVGFAYRRPEHQAAVAATPVRRWYAEELFARFAVLDIVGERGVLGWVDRRDGKG
jgi:hypothetical protein